MLCGYFYISSTLFSLCLVIVCVPVLLLKMWTKGLMKTALRLHHYHLHDLTHNYISANRLHFCLIILRTCKPFPHLFFLGPKANCSQNLWLWGSSCAPTSLAQLLRPKSSQTQSLSKLLIATSMLQSSLQKH